jgi:hypothetical protein
MAGSLLSAAVSAALAIGGGVAAGLAHTVTATDEQGRKELVQIVVK